MKKLILPVFLLLACGNRIYAQVDVQINPVGILFSSINVTAELGVSEDFGIEGGLDYDFQNFDIGDFDYRNNAIGFRAIGKYYFRPEDGIDRWTIGAYARYITGTASTSGDAGNDREEVKNTKFAFGFYTGYKWVSQKNVVFELGLGIGRNFVRTYEYEDGSEVDTSDIPLLNIDLLGRLSLGYRFGGSNKK
ncbi:MAG: DUF3575 domain-containing protein [Haliscomenobacteraceae bacterium CHB4]|nr:hypothetical protein [Saprospiraceae bacterium]MCE7924241.1 DUF3575 domain-containing protein [Haliscomenobacteraceae bacterium CHB4]